MKFERKKRKRFRLFQGFDSHSNSHGLDPSLFDTNHHNDPFLPATTTSNIGWNPPNARPSTHLGFTTATSIIILFLFFFYFFLLIDDPWSPELTGRNSVTNDPWQANPWSANHHTTANNGTGLSVNISDPWGVGANDSRTTTTTSPPKPTNNPKSIDNELSEFFGASASKISSFLDFDIMNFF